MHHAAFALALNTAVFGCALAAEPLDLQARSQALARATDAVVAVHSVAVDDARSSRTLGAVRQGSGVIISAEGLVLTIGYLVLESEAVELVTDDDRHIPARVLGVDLASGFGLLQALAPLQRPPAPIGRADQLRLDEPLTVVSGGVDSQVGIARLVSRRPFSGYWEYHLDAALYTSPPHSEHSGAGLFNSQGELVGIGSLAVVDALGPNRPRLPGNLFVPVELLQPIISELQALGRTRVSERPWLGVNCTELEGGIHVTRVTDDSPADVAGLQPGDRIVRIDGVGVAHLEQLWKTLWRGPGAERDVTLEILRGGRPQTLTVHAVDRAKTLRRPEGI